MPLPTSGPLSLANIQTEFGGTNPISLNEYYAGGAFVPAGTSGTNGPVPSSGAISINNFYGTSAVIPFGEAVYTTPGTYSYVVPAGITSICAVAVGGGGTAARWRLPGGGGGALSYTNGIAVVPTETLTVTVGDAGITTATDVATDGQDSTLSRGGTVLLRAKGGTTARSVNNIATSGIGGDAAQGIGAVRFSGGSSLSNGASQTNGGGAGAAGYAGNGGNGGRLGAPALVPTAGAGGGGGGGGAATSTASSLGGGGVGILGQGANGAAGANAPSTARGGNGSGGTYPPTPANARFGGLYGGGGAAENDDLAHDATAGGNGAIRIIWGTGKSYPFNAT